MEVFPCGSTRVNLVTTTVATDSRPIKVFCHVLTFPVSTRLVKVIFHRLKLDVLSLYPAYVDVFPRSNTHVNSVAATVAFPYLLEAGHSIFVIFELFELPHVF